MSVTGKAALVTGAGQGIGRAIALELARHGAKVVVNDIAGEKAQQTVADITAAGGTASANTDNIALFESAENAVQETVSAFGQIDILVNNAGILRDRMSFNLSEAEWDAVINVCLKGTFACSHFAAKQMKAQGSGRIINITSRSGLRGNVGQANYAAAKAGVLGLTRTMSLEMKRYNVTVNAVCPRAETDMVASIPDDVKAAKDAAWTGSSIRRRGSAEDVAPMIAFLAGEAAADITGQVVGIGGDKISLWTHPDEVAEAFKPGGWSVSDLNQLFRSSVGFQLQKLDKRD